MPDLHLELFSEETPARMQVRAAEDLRGSSLGPCASAAFHIRARHAARPKAVASGGEITSRKLMSIFSPYLSLEKIGSLRLAIRR
jgi:hypothetical protein